MAAIALHELHKRRLEATFQLLEDALERIEHLLAAQRREDGSAASQDALTQEDEGKLRAGVQQLRADLRIFASEFGLQKHPPDIRQVLNAELSSAWVFLENCRPKRMKGYGVPFTPELRARLEQHVEKLLERVLTLRKHVR